VRDKHSPHSVPQNRKVKTVGRESMRGRQPGPISGPVGSGSENGRGESTEV
jgi:hypothetical protein